MNEDLIFGLSIILGFPIILGVGLGLHQIMQNHTFQQSYNKNKDATNETTIECVEKPNICKDRYEFIKLGEKLQENQK